MFGRHPTWVLKTRKKTEKSTNLFGFVRQGNTRHIAAPKTGDTGDTENHKLSEKKPISRNFHRNQCWGRKTCTIVDELLDAECGQLRIKNSRDLSHGGSPHFFEFYLKEFH